MVWRGNSPTETNLQLMPRGYKSGVSVGAAPPNNPRNRPEAGGFSQNPNGGGKGRY